MASLPKPVEPAPLRWRPLAAHDLPVVAALEARIHAAPWSERKFRDAFVVAAVANRPIAAIARRIAYYPPAAPGTAREDALVMRRELGALPPLS